MIKNIDVIFRNPYNYCNLRKIIYHQYLPMLIGIFDQMGAQSDRLRCEVCQNLFLRPMNTGFLRHAVATALTVYGIETVSEMAERGYSIELQQLLPFTVLKRQDLLACLIPSNMLQQLLPFTVLKLQTAVAHQDLPYNYVATALTVYGIETNIKQMLVVNYCGCNSSYRLRY